MSTTAPELRTRAQKVGALNRLIAGGYTPREAAETLGMKVTTARALLNDPDGSEQRRRRQGYRGTCLTCGAATDGSSGRAKAPTECRSCKAIREHEERYWNQERVIDAIQRWARVHGQPPAATEWLNAGMGISAGYPSCTLVQREFGSWSAGIEAAGFPRPPIGYYRDESKRYGPKSWRKPVAHYLECLAAIAVDGEAPALNNGSRTMTPREREGRRLWAALRYRGFRTWPEMCAAAGIRPCGGARAMRRREESALKIERNYRCVVTG